MIDALGGRKSIMALVILAVGAGIDLYSKAGLSANMLQLLSVIFGAFCVGNGVEHVAGAFKKPAEVDNNVAPVDIEPLEQSIANLSQTLEMTAKASEATLTGVGFLVDYIKKVEKGN